MKILKNRSRNFGEKNKFIFLESDEEILQNSRKNLSEIDAKNWETETPLEKSTIINTNTSTKKILQLQKMKAVAQIKFSGWSRFIFLQNENGEILLFDVDKNEKKLPKFPEKINPENIFLVTPEIFIADEKIFELQNGKIVESQNKIADIQIVDKYFLVFGDEIIYCGVKMKNMDAASFRKEKKTFEITIKYVKTPEQGLETQYSDKDNYYTAINRPLLYFGEEFPMKRIKKFRKSQVDPKIAKLEELRGQKINWYEKLFLISSEKIQKIIAGICGQKIRPEILNLTKFFGEWQVLQIIENKK